MKNTKVKRRPTMLFRGIIFLIIISFVYLLSSIFLKQYNNELAVSIQTTERKIKSLSTEKEALKVEIDRLATKNKVVDAIDNEEMSHNKENIVYIQKNDE